MKPQFLCFSLFIILFSQSLNAQISIAPTIGINISKSIFSNYDFAVKNSSFLFGGVNVKYDLNEKISVQTAIQYSQKGYHKEPGDFEVLLPEVRYSYLDILPVVEYRPYKLIGVYGGFNYGFKMNEEYKFPESQWSESNKTIKDYDLGGLLGIRFYYNNFFLNVHYNQSLLNISTIHFTDAQGNEQNGASQKNSTIQIGLGYFIKL